jgi:cobalt-zinc-cadmium efflux system protein
MLDELQACVAKHFDISVEHSTFQIEPADHPVHEHASHS